MGRRKRIALIFDDRLRPETTGTYCRSALLQLADVVHFQPAEMGHIEAGAFDLFLFVDDGLDYAIPQHLQPAAWWAIDTHVTFERCLAKARQAEFVFAAQQQGCADLKAAGIAHVGWLPLACDPDVHGVPEKDWNCENQHEVCFIGNRLPGRREELLAVLEREFPGCLIDRRFGEEMCRAYAASKVVFNCSVNQDLNMRVFETLACGSLLVTDQQRHSGLQELFVPGEHLLTYDNEAELVSVIRWALEHPEECKKIARAGQREVLLKHTYLQRMQTILDGVFPPETTSGVMHSAGYYEHARPDVLALVPESAQKILDLGCGSGKLGAAIKERQTAHVTGVERETQIAARAGQQLDEVVCCDLDDELPQFAEGQFDCVICADLLEHLSDPTALLKQIRDWLTADGTLVVSLPNVQHHSVLTGLLEGNFTYELAGLLDADHQRFFTRRELEKLLFRCGFEVTRLLPVRGPGDTERRENSTVDDFLVTCL